MVEALIAELEESIWTMLEDIESRGGALALIESGEFAEALAEGAYRHAQSVERVVVVGVNRFPAQTEPLDVFCIDPAAEAAQIEAVRAVRAGRGSS